MHFERSLKRAVYEPWRAEYIDYQKLKNLLRDDGSDDGSADEGDKWTDEDEGKFVDELVNVQLERVANFQSSMVQKLKDRAADCENKLEPTVNKAKEGGDNEESVSIELDEETKKTLQEVLKELDGITGEMNELEKYSRINYTGFLKATKKHDRKRGASYRVRPLMQVRLAALPFNKEDYSPLLFRLSTMYSFARQQLEGNKTRTLSVSQSGMDEAGYTTHKCKHSETFSESVY
jgi:SPX domain protein involved in polyphosphate accumulation